VAKLLDITLISLGYHLNIKNTKKALVIPSYFSCKNKINLLLEDAKIEKKKLFMIRKKFLDWIFLHIKKIKMNSKIYMKKNNSLQR
jgi:hypothetical protein